jgi:hypothetical protein
MSKLFAFAAVGLLGLGLAAPAQAGGHGCRDRVTYRYHTGYYERHCAPVYVPVPVVVYRERDCYQPVRRYYRDRDRDCYRPPVCRPRRHCD